MPLLTLFWLRFSPYEGKQRGFLRCAFRGYAPFKGRRRWLRYTCFRKKLQYHIFGI